MLFICQQSSESSSDSWPRDIGETPPAVPVPRIDPDGHALSFVYEDFDHASIHENAELNRLIRQVSGERNLGMKVIFAQSRLGKPVVNGMNSKQCYFINY